MNTLHSVFHFLTPAILLWLLSNVTGQAARDTHLSWHRVWPGTDYLGGEAYSAEGKAWVHNWSGVMVSEDGQHWTGADRNETIPPNPVVQRDFTIGFTLDSMLENTVGKTVKANADSEFRFTNSGVAVLFEDEWWMAVIEGPLLLFFRSGDGITWNLNNDGSSVGSFGLNRSSRLTVSEGRLLWVSSAKKIDYSIFFSPVQLIKSHYATVFEYKEGEWTRVGDRIQLQYESPLVTEVFSLHGDVFITTGNRCIGVTGKRGFSFGSFSAIAGFADADTLLLRSGDCYILVTLSQNKLPQLILPPPSPSESFQMCAKDESLYAVGTKGTVWKSHALEPSNWVQLTDGLDTGEGSRALTYSNGLLRYTSETASLVSSDGIHWSSLPDSLPTPNARFRPASTGFFADSENPQNQQVDHWLYSDLGWSLIASSPENARRGFNCVPEIGLVEILNDQNHQFYTIKPGGRVVSWQTPGISPYPTVNGDMPPNTANPALAYGEGLILGRLVSEAADSALQFNEPTDAYYTDPTFAHSRFWIIKRTRGIHGDDVSLFRSSPIDPYPFDGAQIFNNSWEFSDWFDWVNTEKYPWVFHVAAGWIYVLGPDEDNCWMWDRNEGWFWTSQYYWPTIWSKEQRWRVHERMKAEG